MEETKCITAEEIFLLMSGENPHIKVTERSRGNIFIIEDLSSIKITVDLQKDNETGEIYPQISQQIGHTNDYLYIQIRKDCIKVKNTARASILPAIDLAKKGLEIMGWYRLCNIRNIPSWLYLDNILDETNNLTNRNPKEGDCIGITLAAIKRFDNGELEYMGD